MKGKLFLMLGFVMFLIGCPPTSTPPGPVPPGDEVPPPPPPPPPPIVTGPNSYVSDAILAKLPGITLARIDYGGGHICSGTLVTPTLLLTAAHCIFYGNKIDKAQSISVHSQIGSTYNLQEKKAELATGFTKIGILGKLVEDDAFRDIAWIELTAAVDTKYPLASIATGLTPDIQGAVPIKIFGFKTKTIWDTTTQKYVRAALGTMAAKDWVIPTVYIGGEGGDSGGPCLVTSGGKILLAGVIGEQSPAGVYSAGDSINCTAVQPFLPQFTADTGATLKTANVP